MDRCFLLGLSLVAAITFSNVADLNAAEPIRCSCLFAQSSGYSAIGTRAVCSAITHKNMKGPGESCEISFAGTGYSEQLLSKIVPLVDPSNFDPGKYRAQAFDVTQRSLQAVQARSPLVFTDPTFLRAAIPVYMRAAYLRPETGIDFNRLVDLDKEVLDFSNSLAPLIADVFRGAKPPFEERWREKHRLAVDRGAVRFVYADEMTLVAVFFDPEAQR